MNTAETKYILEAHNNLEKICMNIFKDTQISVGICGPWLSNYIYDWTGRAYPDNCIPNTLKKYFEVATIDNGNAHCLLFKLKEEYLDKVDEVWTIMRLKGIL